ncbi:MAG: alpha-L-rhamnosidase N-terminal domain-containing protein [Bacteroidota bacterium]
MANRREFLKSTSLGASLIAFNPLAGAPPMPDGAPPAGTTVRRRANPNAALSVLPERELDLAPAQWIWYPSARVLQNTFVLFRKPLTLSEVPVKAEGWIIGDSRYELRVNGTRVQWGPAPSDPRYAEVDPMDLTSYLQLGDNVLAATVLYYGQGDGTWPAGKAGFLFHLTLTFADGRTRTVVSDPSWLAHLAKSWPAGYYKRWYLRSLQESFDARVYPYGWDTATFLVDDDWLPAQDIGGAPNKPALCTQNSDYLFNSSAQPERCQLRRRQIPLTREVDVPDAMLEESLWIDWRRSPEEYFDVLTPDAFTVDRADVADDLGNGRYRVRLADPQRGAALTFAYAEQMVGWPYFTITAPEGTVVEMMVHDAHEVGGAPLLNTRFHSWTRFICREGANRFAPFDYESARWLQLHIHGAEGEVIVEQVGMLRRLGPWPQTLHLESDEPALNRLWGACVNTLHNCAHETIVDCMGRERQQYSGDIGHVIHALAYAVGDQRVIGRYVDTFTQGMTNAGFFLDCWPAYDRLVRLAQRELDLTPWGPLLDHGIGTVFDSYYFYLYTGNRDQLAEVYPRLRRFMRYLSDGVGPDGLLAVENLGTPAVWIDNHYAEQRDKQCAFNLYAAAMLQHAFPVLAEAFGEPDVAVEARQLAAGLLQAAIGTFWEAQEGTFVINKPWRAGAARYCYRSLATALLFDQCPAGNTATSARLLADMPDAVVGPFPPNAGWRFWALARIGRVDVILNDLRGRWAMMDAVRLNNTLPESWTHTPDSRSQWSHAAVAPLYIAYMGVLGVHPTAPGFASYQIRPQFGDLNALAGTAYTAAGPIGFAVRGPLGQRELRLTAPAMGKGELLLDAREACDLVRLGTTPSGLVRYRLPQAEEVVVNLQHV